MKKLDLTDGITPIDKKLLTELEKNVETELNTLGTNIINVETKLKEAISSGTNGNGNWIKYADGTMICYGNKSFTYTMTDYWEQFNRTNYLNITYAQPFIEVPVVNGIGLGENIFSVMPQSSTNTNVNFIGFKPKNASTSGTIVINYIAIGKWK